MSKRMKKTQTSSNMDAGSVSVACDTQESEGRTMEDLSRVVEAELSQASPSLLGGESGLLAGVRGEMVETLESLRRAQALAVRADVALVKSKVEELKAMCADGRSNPVAKDLLRVEIQVLIDKLVNDPGFEYAQEGDRSFVLGMKYGTQVVPAPKKMTPEELKARRETLPKLTRLKFNCGRFVLRDATGKRRAYPYITTTHELITDESELDDIAAFHRQFGVLPPYTSMADSTCRNKSKSAKWGQPNGRDFTAETPYETDLFLRFNSPTNEDVIRRSCLQGGFVYPDDVDSQEENGDV